MNQRDRKVEKLDSVVAKLCVAANAQVCREKIEKGEIFNFAKEKFENLSLVCRER